MIDFVAYIFQKHFSNSFEFKLRYCSTTRNTPTYLFQTLKFWDRATKWWLYYSCYRNTLTSTINSLFWSFRHYRTLDSLLVSHQWWSLENHTIRFGSLIVSLELSLQSKSRLGFQIKGVTLKLLCWPRTCWKDSIVDLGLFNPNPYHASDTKYRSVACGYTNRT